MIILWDYIFRFTFLHGLGTFYTILMSLESYFGKFVRNFPLLHFHASQEGDLGLMLLTNTLELFSTKELNFTRPGLYRSVLTGMSMKQDAGSHFE